MLSAVAHIIITHHTHRRQQNMHADKRSFVLTVDVLAAVQQRNPELKAILQTAVA